MAREARAKRESKAPAAAPKSGAVPKPTAIPKNRRVAPKEPAKNRIRLVPRVQLRERASFFWLRVKQVAVRLRTPGMTLLRVLGVCAALAGAVAVGRLLQHHLTTSPAFAIDTVEIKGLSRVQRGELLEAAGIDVGKNVFLRSPEEVRARLLKHPWIATAEVSRRLPSRFDISVRERDPVALLAVEACSEAEAQKSADPSCDEASSIYLVSDEGTVFKRLEGEDPVDLPVITGVERQRFGTDAEFRGRVLTEAVTLLHEYRAAGLWQRLAIGEIHLEATEGLSLYVGDDLTHVRLGTPPFAQKLRRMRKVFDRLEREHARAEYVYLDNEHRPDRVTVRLR